MNGNGFTGPLINIEISLINQIVRFIERVTHFLFFILYLYSTTFIFQTVFVYKHREAYSANNRFSPFWGSVDDDTTEVW